MFKVFSRTLGLSVLFFLVSCASVQVQPQFLPSQPIFVPTKKVLVYDFDILQNTSSYVGRDSASQERIIKRNKASLILANALVKKLQGYGLSAEIAYGSLSTQDNVIIVTGKVMDINEGDRWQRMLIGFGAGASHMMVEVKVYKNDNGHRYLIAAFKVRAKGSYRPGILPMTGVVGGMFARIPEVLLVSSSINVGAELTGDIARDAKSTGQKIAEEIHPLLR